MLRENSNKLKEKLVKILKEIGHMQDIKSAVGKEFIGRNIPVHRVMNVWNNPDYLYTLTDSDEDIKFLFLFSVSLNKGMKDKVDFSLNVKEYFTPLEYQQWIGYKAESKQDDIYPIVFKGVQQLANGMWQTKETAQQVADRDKNNILLYNFKTQRNPKVSVYGINIDLDKRKVETIKERMLEGKQFPDHIKLNILKNYEEILHYDEKSETLTIEKGYIHVIDGQHRKVANTLAVDEAIKKNIELNYTWGLIITYYTEADAREYILQLNEQKPFKQEQKQEWDLNRKENLVVSVITDDRISKLSKVMKEQYAEVKINKGLVTKNIIAEAIAENFRLNDTTDIRGLGKWIVEFTDYLFSLYPEAFITNPYSIQDKSVINNQNLFYGYISMASTYQDSDWKQKVKEKMESIDFSINNPIWREIGIFQPKINKSTRNKIYKLFEEGLM